MFQPLSPLMQVAFIVEDLEAGMAHWARALRVGPFFTLPHVKYLSSVYREQSTTLDISLAFAFSGDMQIELVQLHDDAPSVFREHLDRFGHGAHHLGAVCDDFEAEIERLVAAGAKPIHRLLSETGAETIFLEVPGYGNGSIELIKGSERLRRRFADMKAAAANWDGQAIQAS